MIVSVRTRARGVCRLLIGSAFSALAAGLMLFASAAFAQQPLSFFKNYFVTGDYAVAGAGMQGKGVRDNATRTFILRNAPRSMQLDAYPDSFATASLGVTGIPSNPDGTPADILAAFLYWGTIESTEKPSSAVGTIQVSGEPLRLIIGKQIGSDRTTACWSSGGGTGGATGGPVLRVYRADVFRNLPLIGGRRSAAGPFVIKLPDSGSNGNTRPLTAGASLVVIYRLRSQAAPLRAVVIYDGSYTANNNNPVFSQTIRGFYQASAFGPSARITHIVADGQSNFGEELTFLGDKSTSPNSVVASPSVFTSALGPSWDNATFDVSGRMGGDDRSAVTTVRPAPGNGSSDCLSWGAVIFSTTVQDTDKDGLLDVWESEQGFREVLSSNADSPQRVALPGANPSQKDIYVQLGFMKGPDGHSHLPKLQALDMVYRSFQKAPMVP